MNHIYKSVAILLLSTIGSMSVFAEDKPMNMQQGKPAGQSMKKNMDMGMSEEMKDKKARERQIYILKIDDLSARIWAEKNLKMKQILMDEQLQVIKKHQEKRRKMKKMMMMQHHKKMMNKKKAMNM